jgi:hypothetical protein
MLAMSAVLGVAVSKVKWIKNIRAHLLALESSRNSPRKIPMPLGFRLALDETFVVPLCEDEHYRTHEYLELASARACCIASLKPQLNAFLDRPYSERPIFCVFAES